MNVLVLLDDGWEARRIAEALYLDEGTVWDHRRRYETPGRAGMERLNYVRRCGALDEVQLQELCAHVEARVPQTAKEVCAWAHGAFGAVDTANAMTKPLKRLGFVHNKPKCVPAKADEAAQRRFVAETLAPAMRAAGADRPLYFVDATHPAHTGRPAHGWMRKVLFNKYYPTFADFRKAFDDFFANIGGWKEEIERLLTPKFHYIGAPENGIP